jgi:hypothetical protein
MPHWKLCEVVQLSGKLAILKSIMAAILDLINTLDFKWFNVIPCPDTCGSKHKKIQF